MVLSRRPWHHDLCWYVRLSNLRESDRLTGSINVSSFPPSVDRLIRPRNVPLKIAWQLKHIQSPSQGRATAEKAQFYIPVLAADVENL